MKGRNPHAVYLSHQALDVFVALHTRAASPKFVRPSRTDAVLCLSNAILNRVTQIVAERAQAAGLSLESFTAPDLRRAGTTRLNEIGFNRDWIEKCLAHEDGRSTRSIYSKAEYAKRRRTCCKGGPTWSMRGSTGRPTCHSWCPGNVVVPALSATVSGEHGPMAFCASGAAGSRLV